MGNNCRAYCWANEVPGGNSIEKLDLEELNQKVIKARNSQSGSGQFVINQGGGSSFF